MGEHRKQLQAAVAVLFALDALHRHGPGDAHLHVQRCSGALKRVRGFAFASVELQVTSNAIEG
eukprot:5440278-Prymnesium_polylepis.3